ncbi:hypothetical protein [Variovorax ginsengisoli]|uniref:DUF4352 domain-containing protein n=1 Tax=Variovorax ginsengisoli TaxID=363844 RepID=A0ABT8S285_9BURK|nr:hypothetical protein [Variovorax ginsengisoli]MDN8612301.1 hypothetical protein [Variovorax ginsengisoli]MDO1531471.1 hypothetical protein [Variovorax ginsengisoli]
MSDEEKPRRWWQTLPGVITSLTAAVTAVAGLIVAVRQAGWIGPPSPPAATQSSAQVPAAPPVPSAPPTSGAAARAVELPALRDYTLGPGSGNVTFTLLQAELSPQTAEQEALTIRLRLTNHGNYDTNFWDRSFRWSVGGVPMAPDGGLNELVPARSAKEGRVNFVIPRGSPDGKLEISYGDDRTEIPLALGAAR